MLPVLISPHLEHVPRLATLTTWRLSGRDLEVLCRKTNWALNTQFLALRTLDELATDLLERRDFLRSQSDADLVDLWLVELRRLLWVLERHVGFCGGRALD